MTDKQRQAVESMLNRAKTMHKKVLGGKNANELSTVAYARSEYWYGKITGIQDVLNILGK